MRRCKIEKNISLLPRNRVGKGEGGDVVYTYLDEGP